VRALLYGRVSHDPSGHGRSVDSQLDECRKWAAREGWDVVDEVRDVDRSASRHARRRREGWDGVTARLQAGAIDVLVTWEASRAQRDLEQYAELRRWCEQTGTRWAYSGTVYDLAERSDRFRTGLDALVAEDEAGRISERVRRGVAAAAANGRPHGRLLYGYRRVYDESNGALLGQEPDGIQSVLVSEIMRRFLAGESINGIAADLTNRGVPSPGRSRDGGRSSVWRRSQLHRMLSNPAYAGFRVHQGQVVGKAEWPAIVDADDWRRVQARLADPERRAPRRTATGPVNLLTGIARCGVCGVGLVGGQDRGRRQYICRAAGFHVARDMNYLDAYVTAIVLERLAQADTSLDDSPGEDVLAARREADEMRARLKAAADQFVAGKLSAATLSRVEAQLTLAIADAERRARYAGLPTTVAELADGDAAWDDLSVDQRREVVRGLITLRVNRSARGRGARGFDPASVAVQFRH
jgi:site-specific DNA recombinase